MAGYRRFNESLLLPSTDSGDSGRLARVHLGSPKMPETSLLTTRFLPCSHSHKKVGNESEKQAGNDCCDSIRLLDHRCSQTVLTFKATPSPAPSDLRAFKSACRFVMALMRLPMCATCCSSKWSGTIAAKVRAALRRSHLTSCSTCYGTCCGSCWIVGDLKAAALTWLLTMEVRVAELLGMLD